MPRVRTSTKPPHTRNDRPVTPEEQRQHARALGAVSSYAQVVKSVHDRLHVVVNQARENGATWDEIAAALGCTRTGLSRRLSIPRQRVAL